MAFNKNKVMDSARKYVEKGQVDRAIKDYLRIVQEDPRDVRVWLKVGDLYAKKGAKQEATETYLKVAKFYSEQGFYLKAVAVYKQILKLDARLVEVNLKLAELYRQLGLLSDAMQHFEMVAAHFHREGKTTEALATVRQLVDLDPDNVATRIKLAELYSKEEMVEEAIKEFVAACDQLRARNRQDDFIKVAERLLWHKPDEHGLNRELATLYLRRNDPRRALQKLQVSFKADPRDVETLALLAQAFQALDQKGKTVSVLKELARILDEDRKKSQAADVHRKILMYVPDDAESREYLGESAPRKAAPAVAAAPVPRAPAPHVPRAPAPHVPRAPEPAARKNRNFAITSSDLPARHGKATGSMPIIAPEGEFSDPELVIEADDDDFAADFEMEESAGRFDTGSVAGELHAEEIIKILTETDVYVKYGLHQKAIDHLKRVFELDEDNTEAHERLKEIYVSQGREGDAMAELLRLAELAASSDPRAAEEYLREILALDGTYEPAFDLAHRFHLDITAGPDVEILEDLSDSIEIDPDQLGSGAVAPLQDDELDFDAMGFGDDEFSVEGIGGGIDDIDDIHDEGAELPTMDDEDDDFEFEALAGQSDAEYEFELEDSHSIDVVAADEPIPPSTGTTQEVSLDQFEEVVAVEEDARDLEFGMPALDGFDSEAASGFATAEGRSFDSEAARAFDAEMESAEQHALDAAPMAAVERMGSDFGGMRPPADDYQDSSGTQLSPPQFLDAGPADDVAADLLEEVLTNDTLGGDNMIDADDAVDAADPYLEETSGTSLEDDLDEADFFVGQGLWGEARDILEGLLVRHSGHPLVTAKLRDVAAMEAAEAAPSGQGGEVPAVGHQRGTETPGEMTVDMDGSAGLGALDDIGALDDDLGALGALDALGDPAAGFDDVTAAGAVLGSDDTRDGADESAAPAVLLERPVEDEDADTHYDLGQAYREMGLHGEAIKAFEKVLQHNARLVQCHLMIGLCHREQGSLSEAVQQFKRALHVAEITDREKLTIYFEIGVSYQALNDPAEALYYFDMVNKKEPTYLDVGQRVETLRAATGRSGDPDTHRTSVAPDDIDAALDGLSSERDITGRAK